MFDKRWRIGTLLGFPVEINLTFLLLLGVVLMWFGGLAGLVVVAIAFGSVLLHELGHAVVARRLGVGVSGIELHFFGGAAKMMDLPRSANHEMAIAAAGPAVSLMLAGLGLGVGVATGSWFIAAVGWINVVLALFNLIPALPMDGGRILRAALSKRLGFVRATDVAVTIARAVAVGFVALGLIYGAYQLLLLAPFLWILGTQERALAHRLGGYPQPLARRWPGEGGAGRVVVRQRDGRVVIEVL
jgi:Zn-dependent protease